MNPERSYHASNLANLIIYEVLNMQMRIYDKVRFAAIFFKSLWQPADSMTAKITLSEEGEYLLTIDEPRGSETGMMYR
jgi:hypothetical protein